MRSSPLALFLVAGAAALLVLSSSGLAGASVHPSPSPLVTSSFGWTNVTQGTLQPCCGAAAYDPPAQSALAVGPPTEQFENGTWAYRPGSTTVVSLNGTAVAISSATFDLSSGDILAVGSTPCFEHCQSRAYNCTLWTWSSWTWQLVGAVPGAPYYACPQIVYDSEDGYDLLSGEGWSPGTGNASSEETWTYAGGVWENITAGADSPLWAGFSWSDDPAAGYVVAFGGCARTCEDGDDQVTATFHAGAWTNLTGSGSAAPSPRALAAMAYSTTCACVVLFGGFHARNFLTPLAVLGDTWTFGAGGWTNVSDPGPSPRPAEYVSGGLVDDPVNHAVLLFGGLGANGLVSSDGTWAWGNYTAPSAVSPTSSLPPILLLVVAVMVAVIVLLTYLALRRRSKRRAMPPVEPEPVRTWV